jgi:hypothetical protein
MRERQRSLLVPDKRTVAETDTERAGLTHDLACEWIGVGGVKSSMLDDGSMVVLVLVVGCCRRRSQAAGKEELNSPAKRSRAVSSGKAQRKAMRERPICQ